MSNVPPQVAQLLERAQHDADFRKKLIADPAAVARENGVKVPDGIKFNFLEERPGERYIVLPPLVGDELSPAELDAVAGGCVTWSG